MNIQTAVLPPHAEMVRAMLERDTAYEGVFFTAVKTTGIFCRPSCTARKPKPENVEFFAHAEDCLSEGQARIPNSVFLPKPFSLNDLTATVQGQLH